MSLFGKLKCKKQGHSYNGCKRVRCCEVRDEGHHWRAGNDKLHYCTNCRKSEPHVWDGCKCRSVERQRTHSAMTAFASTVGRARSLGVMRESARNFVWSIAVAAAKRHPIWR